MHKNIKNRLMLWLMALGLVGAGVIILLKVTEDNIMFFYPPSKVPLVHTQTEFRLGGIVKEGSIKKDNKHTNFTLTDYKKEIEVKYRGPLPSLFREGQGIVAEGKLEDSIFIAKKLLAKHDENYMPPEIKDNLEKSNNNANSLE